MPDLHRKTTVTVRASDEERASVQKALDGTDWTFNDFVLACVAMLAKRPQTFLKQLEPFKPEKRRGRPPKEPRT
jgi:hypothetical protein